MSFFSDVDDKTPKRDFSGLKRKVKKNASDIPTKELEIEAEKQGWVARETKKPGPKRREPRSVLTMNGPERVITAFREYADAEEISQWKALENLMNASGIRVPQKQGR